MKQTVFDYFYGQEAESFSFYRIPKVLFTDERFAGLTCEAKVLYGLMLDRMSLSVRNGWLDEDGKVYDITRSTSDKLEGIFMEEYQALDLEQYKENEEEALLMKVLFPRLDSLCILRYQSRYIIRPVRFIREEKLLKTGRNPMRTESISGI